MITRPRAGFRRRRSSNFPEFQGRNMKPIRKTCFAQRIRDELYARFDFRFVLEASRHVGRFISLSRASALTRGASSVLLLLCAGLSPAETGAARVETIVDGLPLSFEANVGQFDKRVKFLARGQDQRVFLTERGMVLVFQGRKASGGSAQAWVGLEFLRGSEDAKFEAVDELAAVTNYF